MPRERTVTTGKQIIKNSFRSPDESPAPARRGIRAQGRAEPHVGNGDQIAVPRFRPRIVQEGTDFALPSRHRAFPQQRFDVDAAPAALQRASALAGAHLDRGRQAIEVEIAVSVGNDAQGACGQLENAT